MVSIALAYRYLEVRSRDARAAEELSLYDGYILIGSDETPRWRQPGCPVPMTIASVWACSSLGTLKCLFRSHRKIGHRLA